VWGSAPQPRDPSAVFFSGGDNLRKMLAEVCNELGLKLLAQATPKNFAAMRWDQLRMSHVAVFDFTTYLKPDPCWPCDLAVTGPIAAISYELGIALTLGRPIIVVTKDDQNPPFDVNIEPVRLRQGALDKRQLAEAIDDVIYGLQWGGGESSIAATRAYLQQTFSDHENFIVTMSLRLIDDAAAHDPIKFRRFIEPVLGGLGSGAPLMLFPVWPGSYPKMTTRRLFHVTAFNPPWASNTMSIANQTCKAAQPEVEYIRGDRVPDPNIIRSIWDNLCQATHVVVDLTNLTANVALELGIAHTLGRNVLMVTQDDTNAAMERFPAIAKMRMQRYSLTGGSDTFQLDGLLGQFLNDWRLG
jgi:hypothetical protein